MSSELELVHISCIIYICATSFFLIEVLSRAMRVAYKFQVTKTSDANGGVVTINGATTCTTARIDLSTAVYAQHHEHRLTLGHMFLLINNISTIACYVLVHPARLNLRKNIDIYYII
ncbi:hypothetical protein ACJX0J_020648 [Zea mays]